MVDQKCTLCRGQFNRNLSIPGEKKLRYTKIYAINLRIIEVKIIDTKREIFGTLKETTFYQKIRLIELRYIKVSLYMQRVCAGKMKI